MLNILEQQALMRPLIFGDPDQIAALKTTEIKIERKEEYDRKLQAGTIKRYHVNISFSGETAVFCGRKFYPGSKGNCRRRNGDRRC